MFKYTFYTKLVKFLRFIVTSIKVVIDLKHI